MNAVYVCIGQAIWERPRLKYKKTGLQPLGLAGLLSWIEQGAPWLMWPDGHGDWVANSAGLQDVSGHCHFPANEDLQL
jgi:hypothetical protein